MGCVRVQAANAGRDLIPDRAERAPAEHFIALSPEGIPDRAKRAPAEHSIALSPEGITKRACLSAGMKEERGEKA